MGQDKASLPYRGVTLLEHVVQTVEEALGGNGTVAIVGAANQSRIGYPVYADEIAGCGPMGGIYTALTVSDTAWNLIAACDMPGIEPEILRTMLNRAETSQANCVLACNERSEPEPLCGIYHRRCLPILERALLDKRLKLKDLIPQMGAELVPAPTSALANINTPGEWESLQGQAT